MHSNSYLILLRLALVVKFDFMVVFVFCESVTTCFCDSSSSFIEITCNMVTWFLGLKLMTNCSCTEEFSQQVACLRIVPRFYSFYTWADPGFFLGGGALVSCATSNTIKPHSFFCRIPVVLETAGHLRGRGGAHPPHPPPRSAPAIYFISILSGNISLIVTDLK